MVKTCLVEGKTEGIKFKSKESKIMAAQLRFTEKQANAILDMRLYKLIGLELEALIKEHEETMANIYRYEEILERRDSMAQVIMNELDAIKKEYGKPRRTVVENGDLSLHQTRFHHRPVFAPPQDLYDQIDDIARLDQTFLYFPAFQFFFQKSFIFSAGHFKLDAIKKEYGKPRRTVVENGEEAVYEEKKIEEMEVMCLVDRFGYVKTVDMPTYERAVHNF